jgi:hypothetical protein
MNLSYPRPHRFFKFIRLEIKKVFANLVKNIVKGKDRAEIHKKRVVVGMTSTPPSILRKKKSILF